MLEVIKEGLDKNMRKLTENVKNLSYQHKYFLKN